MLQKLANNRVQASFIHLLASALIAGTAVFAAVLIWYPGELLEATGAKKIFLILLGVDICLGPLLTLLIFNKSKPELSRDLLIIFIIQIAALLYGLYSIGISRPVYVVFAIDRFEVVHALEISKQHFAQAKKDEYKKPPLLKPKWVSAIRPTDLKEREALLFGEYGADLAQLPKYYDTYEKSIDAIIAKAKPLKALKQTNKDMNAELSTLLKKYPNSERYGFIPITASKKDLSAIIDLTSGRVIETSLLQPW